ncbi:GNAT family N-acetyltransferase [Kribbella kalugense]|uniref:Acetyltransferase (GNAT) family protein n=1 Tax=Kribbella kalugense TaxID=2512221 RepID=A0A4R7ZVK6_9ACTN|nr:GNAT family N-acetyltransferase [Kribbella kalugense]TDW22137.1 acetyltransferase (GNAT) family protein [Kribbella kalugense]
MAPIVISTLAERPEYLERLYEFADTWPKFMFNDPIGNAFMGQVAGRFPDQCVVATEDGEPVAHGRSIPFVFPDENRTELPSGGWDRVLHWGFSDSRNGREPNVSSALEILIRPSHQGRGLSHTMLEAMRQAVKAKGHSTLYAPVRPNGKTDPDQPMTEYVEQLRPDGLPVDPWLRVHVKAGAEIVQVAPRSMVIAGTLDEWREWTGLPFDTTGDVVVPKALVPVHCDVRHNYAVYVEPNVWVRHDL